MHKKYKVTVTGGEYNMLLKETSVLPFNEWVDLQYSDDPEFLGEEGLIRAYEDEELNKLYREYLYDKFND